MNFIVLIGAITFKQFLLKLGIFLAILCVKGILQGRLKATWSNWNV